MGKGVLIMKNNEIMKGLKAPFNPKDIEWKTQSATKRDNKISVLVVPYLDARAIMDRLDEVCGPFWKTEYHQMTVETAKGPKQGFSCILSIKIGAEWVSRVDGAEVSDIESIKGGHSNALKRAAVQWGIGRYLYDLPNFWVPLQQQGSCNVYGKFKINGQQEQVTGKFDAPRLQKKFLPEGFTYPGNNNSRPEQPQNQGNPASNGNSNGNQQPQNGQERQSTQQNQQPQNKRGNKPSDQAVQMAKKSPLEHTISLFKELSITSDLVPGLINKIVGERKAVGKATEDELRAIVKALMPVKKYLDYCKAQGLSEDQMLDYAQITTKESLKNPLNLILKMDSVILTETTKLIHEDRLSPAQTA